VLPYEFTLAFPIDPSQVYGALPLDLSDHLRHCVLWRDRDHQIHVVRHNVTLFDPAFLLQRQPLEYLAEMLPQLWIQRFSPALGNEYDVVAGSRFGVSSMDSLKRQTVTATPAEPGASLAGLE
jgi:hypothetical protein